MSFIEENVATWKDYWLETVAGDYYANPSFCQPLLYYFMDINATNLADAQSYINYIATYSLTFTGDWALPASQVFYINCSTSDIQTTINNLLTGYNFTIGLSYVGDFSYVLEQLALRGRPIFCFFVIITSTNASAIKTYMDTYYLASMLGQSVLSSTTNDLLGYTGYLISTEVYYYDGISEGQIYFFNIVLE